MSRPDRYIKDQQVSRSTMVIPVVFHLEEKTGDIFTLVEKRGEGLSHPGKWCCPCGFLDWDETLSEACRREVKEKTGLDIDEKSILFVEVCADPKNPEQTIDLWHMCWANGKDFDMSGTVPGAGVEEVRWLKVARVKKGGLFGGRIDMTIYRKSISNGFGIWAYHTHPVKILEMLKMFVKGGKILEVDE